MKINVDQIEAVCKKYEGCDPSYFVGDIPASKSAGARLSQNISEEEPIVALVDFTVFGSASDSLVITDRGIAWKKMGERPKRLTWGDLVKCKLRAQRKWGINHIIFNDQLSMDLAGTTALSDKGTFLQLLKELQTLPCSVKEQQSNESRNPPAEDVKHLLEVCGRYGGRSRSYFVGEIPEAKTQKARESLGIPNSEPILALIDFTLLGSAEYSLVIAKYGIYWRNRRGSPSKVNWSELAECSLSEKHDSVTKNIVLSDDLSIRLLGSSKLDQKDDHTVLDLLTELKQFSMLREKMAEDNSGASNMSGLIVCEFCGGKVKSNVTFCKHCGLKLRS